MRERQNKIEKKCSDCTLFQCWLHHQSEEKNCKMENMDKFAVPTALGGGGRKSKNQQSLR